MTSPADATGSPDRHRVPLLLVLTFVTGVVDVVSYVGLGHVFVANMTGNVVLLGAALTSDGTFAILPVALAFVSFFAGAAIAGRAHRHLPAPGGSALALLGSSGILLVGCGITLGVGGPGPPVVLVVVAVLALAMGVNGGFARVYSSADLPSVVVTSTLVGLAFSSSLGAGGSVRWRRRAAAVAALVVGGVVGGLLLRTGALVPLAVAGLVTAAVGVVSFRRERRPVAQSG